MKKQTTNNPKNKIFKFLFLILVIFLLSNVISCYSKIKNKNELTSENAEKFKIQNDELEKVVNAVIDISANDFYKNQNPLPVEFRNVKIKYHLKPSKELLFILCGQFQTKDNSDWTQFATIKNSDYEQWVGSNGSTYCENSTELTYTKIDLSTQLKNKLNSLQNLKK